MGFHPISLYLREVDAALGKLVSVYLSVVDLKVGFKWKKGVRQPVPFRLAVASFTTPCNEEGEEVEPFTHVVPNVEEIEAYLRLLGTGLVV